MFVTWAMFNMKYSSWLVTPFGVIVSPRSMLIWFWSLATCHQWNILWAKLHFLIAKTDKSPAMSCPHNRTQLGHFRPKMGITLLSRLASRERELCWVARLSYPLSLHHETDHDHTQRTSWAATARRAWLVLNARSSWSTGRFVWRRAKRDHTGVKVGDL